MKSALAKATPNRFLVRTLFRAVVHFGLYSLLIWLMSACEPTSISTPTTAPFSPMELPRATPRPVTPMPTVTPGGNTTVSYARDIQPLLNANCVRCHGGIAGLWLSDYEHIMLGSINGPVVVPGDPDASPLYTYVDMGLMPPDAPALSQDDIELIRRWIEEGAPKN